MAEINEDDSPVVFVQWDEEQLDFVNRLSQLLKETQSLGPVIHSCLMMHAIGRLCYVNLNHIIPQMRYNCLMNFDFGVQAAMMEILEASAKERPN